MKLCSKCHSMKPLESFYFTKNGNGRRKAACKQCHSAETRARYAENPYPRLEYAKRARKDPSVRRKINDRRNSLRRKNPSLELWRLAKIRARQKGLLFNLEVADVKVPDVCPVLGIALEWGCDRRQLDKSPTVDRISPKLGYTKGNVQVISWRANRIKSDATESELAAILAYVKAHAVVAAETPMP